MNRSKNQVMAERATLLSQEQSSFTNPVNAYVGVIQAQQLLALAINNEQVLAKQLQATNDRFRVGEITRTDVAQAEAALASATAQLADCGRQPADGAWHVSADYRVLPPGDLVEPQPLAVPVKTEQDAMLTAANSNPQVVSALFNDAAAKDAIDVAFGLAPAGRLISRRAMISSGATGLTGEEGSRQPRSPPAPTHPVTPPEPIRKSPPRPSEYRSGAARSNRRMATKSPARNRTDFTDFHTVRGRG